MAIIKKSYIPINVQSGQVSIMHIDTVTPQFGPKGLTKSLYYNLEAICWVIAYRIYENESQTFVED